LKIHDHVRDQLGFDVLPHTSSVTAANLLASSKHQVICLTCSIVDYLKSHYLAFASYYAQTHGYLA